jgi:excisionase family DNA binding protein
MSIRVVLLLTKRPDFEMTATHSDSPGARKWKLPAASRAQQGISFRSASRSTVTSASSPRAEPVKVGDRLYTCKEAGELTNTTERFWRGLIEQRRVKYTKLGKFVKIPESSINQLLADGTVDPL